MDEMKIKKALLARQSELRARIGAIQADEDRDVEEGLSDGAQLWQASEIRGGPIDEARVEALPYATLCIDDAKKAEQPTQLNPLSEQTRDTDSTPHCVK